MSHSPAPNHESSGEGTSEEPKDNVLVPLEVLRTVDVLSPAQAAKIRADIEIWDLELNSLSGISQDRRDELDVARRRGYAMLAPIRRVPPELLAEIFQSCFLWSASSPAPSRMWLLALGHVCQRWRSALICTPQLWTKIPDVSNPSLIGDLWIPRSAQLPLDISAQGGALEELTAYGDPRADSVWDTLISVRVRWQDVRVTVSELQLQSLPPRASYPSLRYLDIVLTDGPLSLGQDFLDAPVLRRFGYHGVELESTELPWPQLQEIRCHEWLDFSMVEDINGILRRCPELIRCDAAVAVDQMSQWDEISHSKLQELTLYFSVQGIDVEEPLSRTISSLIFPELRSFALLNESWEPWDQREFTTFLSRSQCTLRAFKLSNTPMSDRSLVTCLSSMPYLESLSLIEVVNDGRTLLARLTRRDAESTSQTPSEPYMLPRLRQFELSWTGKRTHCDVDEAFLAAMIESRLPGPSNVLPQSNAEMPSISHLLKFEIKCFQVLETLPSLFESWKKRGLAVCHERLRRPQDY